jgi:phage terminase large subunit GpA-like protein
LSVPDWADKYRRLAKGAGSTSGHWRTERVEIGRGPMLAATEPGVRTITVMVATQLLKTSLIENIFGYHAHLDPCPMLIVQPKEDAAEQFSKERITPMIRATPVLDKLVGTVTTRSAEETLLFKGFVGGFLALAGAGSPDNLSRRPIRLVFYDEVDKYPVTREGDPIRLGDERLATFVNRLSVRACSPTIEDQSRIAASYAESDRRRASVSCPHCAHRQFPEFFSHVNWEKEGEQHRSETAHVYCEACGAAWSEGERLRALQTIRWHQTRAFTCCGERQVPLDDYEKAWRDAPDGAVERMWDWWAAERYAVYLAKCRTCGRHAVSNAHAGFQASKLYSPWPADEPAAIAEKWLTSKDDEDQKQAWFNTQLGLPYRPHAGKELHVDVLTARGEVWAAEVPDGVGLITVGIDVQDDRVEAEIVGWGRDEESWSIAHEVIEGDPEQASFWNGQVDALLKRIWMRADGRPFEVAGACIDSGYHTQRVYENLLTP